MPRSRPSFPSDFIAVGNLLPAGQIQHRAVQGDDFAFLIEVVIATSTVNVHCGDPAMMAFASNEKELMAVRVDTPIPRLKLANAHALGG